MRLRPIAFALSLLAALPGLPALRAQQPAVASAVLPSDQQLLTLLRSVSAHALNLLPLLDQVHASDWVSRGAPETYALQLASARRQIQGIEADFTALASHPDHMQDCMRALFRVQTFHRSLDTLLGGLRKYQNPALADLIQSVAAEDQEDLGKLQDYLLELANQKEQEYLVVDHEAQRCRAILSREPATPRKNAPKE